MDQKLSVKFDNDEVLSFVQGEDRSFQLSFFNDTTGKPIDLTDALQVAVHFPRKGGGTIKRRKVGFDVLTADLDIETGHIASSDHGLVDDEIVQVSTSGTLPTGYVASTDYKVDYVDENTFGLKNATTDALIKPSTQGSGGFKVAQQNAVLIDTDDNPVLGEITLKLPLEVTSVVREGLAQGFQAQFVDSDDSLRIIVLAEQLDVEAQPSP